MNDKTDYNSLSSFEMNESLRDIMVLITNKGLELNVKGMNYADLIKSITTLLQSINPEYYTREELSAFLGVKKIAYKLMGELDANVIAKDTVHF